MQDVRLNVIAFYQYLANYHTEAVKKNQKNALSQNDQHVDEHLSCFDEYVTQHKQYTLSIILNAHIMDCDAA